MSQHAFSADVSLTLEVNGNDYLLSHVGRDFFVVAEDHGTIAPQAATLLVQVDETVQTTRIQFLDTISGADCRTRYQVVESEGTHVYLEPERVLGDFT